ncbi:leucine-rich repeat domain-containing protein [Pseudomonas sp. BW7P1]|uniref:leucine-rich repeat domain-containing protein n=1 Tax=Pseudomonas TaxID=286 RepID=UPI0021ADE16C|nr:hypothetical protein [Pseudomonas sp. BW7P1]UWI62487.1 hypothetical protein NWV16_03520 [Pseudomonas sp. BW7P1]
MAGKPPKVKPVPDPNKTPDSGAVGSYRPPSPPSSMPHLPVTLRLEPSQPSSRPPDSIAVTPSVAMEVSPLFPANDEFALLAAGAALTDYRIPRPKSLGEADAQGIRMFKQRQYVPVDDVHFVQVAPDPESGLFRAMQARELSPSGPLLIPDSEGRFWVALDNSDPRNHMARFNSLHGRTVEPVSEAPGRAPLPLAVDPAAVHYGQTAGMRGGAGNNPRLAKSVADRVRDLYPQLSNEEQTAFINERLKSDPWGTLTRLEKEFETLRDELALWRDRKASPHWVSPAQRQAREQFSAMLQDIWQRKSVSRWGYGDYHFSSDIDFSGELPGLSARFEYVTELVLKARIPGTRIGAFLDSFPNVQYLMVAGVEMEQLPPGIFQMRALRQLTLNNCSLELTEATAEGVSRIETLTVLNLARNPLKVAPHVGFMPDLKELTLYEASLSKVPTGVDALGELRVLALQDNDISDLGDELFDIPDTQDLFVGLVNNPLSNASRQRVIQYLDNSSMDRKIEIQIEEPLSEAEFESGSSESGFGTGSDSD